MSGATEPLVSVVTPFYNTAPYLAECIESVLAQTYGKFEYVLLDNCSSDGSSEIAARYAAKDARIKLHKNTALLPQVENYNAALRLISPGSEFCKIVQADDWIYKNCLEEMVAAARSAPDVVLVSSYSLYDALPGSSPRVGNAGLDYARTVLPGPECARGHLLGYFEVFGSPTSVMYLSREVRAQHDFYRLDSPAEDTEACLDLLAKGSFAFVHQVLSFNRRSESQSTFFRHMAMHGWMLNRVVLAHRLAPKFMSESEADAVIRGEEQAHYRLLGRGLLEMRPKPYWQFHEDGLALVGQRIDRRRVALNAAMVALDFVGNPKASLDRLRGRAPRIRSWLSASFGSSITSRIRTGVGSNAK